jgi:transposase
LIFIDETGASTKMARRHGRTLRGERLRMSVPHGHWKTTTFVGALRLTGMTAPMVLDRAMTGAWFLAYVEQVLSPTLTPGDVVIRQSACPQERGGPPGHRGERRGAAPPPALLARLQSHRERLRQAEGPPPKSRCSTVAALERAIAEAIDTFTPAECANYFAAAGYDAT